MSDFDAAFEQVIGYEGGYVFDPDDAGGETNWGIAKRWYPHLNIKLLTKEDAKQIYWKEYWNRLLLAQIQDDDIATEIFEQAINMGRSVAAANAQHATNLCDSEAGLLIDGFIGPKTITAINRIGQRRKAVWLKCMNGLQFVKYLEIVDSNPKQSKFFVGWLKRVEFNG